jgi:hypothetical protein
MANFFLCTGFYKKHIRTDAPARRYRIRQSNGSIYAQKSEVSVNEKGGIFYWQCNLHTKGVYQKKQKSAFNQKQLPEGSCLHYD